MRGRHYSEDDLTLYHYAEGPYRQDRALRNRRRRSVEHHLEVCSTCASLYREIAGTLAMIGEPDLPERGDQYGLEVWQRIRHRLPEQEEGWLAQWLRWDRLALAAAALTLLLAAFIAGRAGRQPADVTPGTTEAVRSAVAAGDLSNETRRRILLTSVADHLDRSERVLTDIMNAPDRDDISIEQGWAEDLLTASRLYRQDAIETGEQSIASVLDEIERSLLEIVHSPSRATAADLEQIRRRIDAASLLFKVRVMSDQLRQQEEGSALRSLQKTSTTKSS